MLFYLPAYVSFVVLLFHSRALFLPLVGDRRRRRCRPTSGAPGLHLRALLQRRAPTREDYGLAGAEARGDADAGAAGGVRSGGVRGGLRARGLPAHADRLRRRRRAHGARHRPQLALLQP